MLEALHSKAAWILLQQYSRTQLYYVTKASETGCYGKDGTEAKLLYASLEQWIICCLPAQYK